MTDPILEGLKTRLDALERQSRRLRVLCLATLAVVVLVSAFSYQRPTFATASADDKTSTVVQDLVRTHRLEVVDSAGKVRLVLDADSGKTAAITIQDKSGAVKTLLDEVGLFLYRGDKIPVALADLDGPGLMLADSTGKPRVMVAIPSNKPPVLQITDKNSKVVWSAP